MAGRDIAALRTKLTALAAAKLDAATRESSLKAELARLDTDVMTASAELTARGAEDISDQLVRVEQLRERARGLAAVIVERRRALERDRGRLLDAGVVASLESDAARYAEELAIVRADLDTLHPEIVALEADEERFGAERQGVLELFDSPTAARASSAVAEVRGELRSRRAAAERAEAELMRGRHRMTELGERIADLGGRLEELQHECHACELVESRAAR